MGDVELGDFRKVAVDNNGTGAVVKQSVIHGAALNVLHTDQLGCKQREASVPSVNNRPRVRDRVALRARTYSKPKGDQRYGLHGKAINLRQGRVEKSSLAFLVDHAVQNAPVCKLVERRLGEKKVVQGNRECRGAVLCNLP